MIDLHTHTILSDGELIPAEHIRRAEVKGYRILGMSDHVGLATLPQVVPVLLEAAKRENELEYMQIVAGVELTHVRVEHIEECANRARELGAQIVIVHGETLVEPVKEGTNRAAIEAGVDVLAHPGLISAEDAELAATKNVLLEISAKAGHSLANGHVARVARAAGARLIFGSDAHTPSQLPTREQANNICLAAGLSTSEVAEMFEYAEHFAKHKAMQQEMDQNADW